MSSMCGDINDGLICNDDAGHKGDHSWNRDFEVTTWAKRPHAEAANAECPHCNGALSIGVYCGKCNPPTSAAPTEGATMKDSHGQTVQVSEPALGDSAICGGCDNDISFGPQGWTHEDNDQRGCERAVPDNETRCQPTIVQDYREYTEREILLGILDFSRRTGWGDPANLGHWLGAAQRWAKERV